MSASRRRLIREKFTEILKGQTSVGERVFSNPSAPTWAEELPVILIRTLTESSEMYGQAPREYMRTLQIMVEIIVEGGEDGLCPSTDDDGQPCQTFVEDKLDDIAHEIEDALFLDTTVGDTASDLMPVSAEFDFVAEGASPIASARMIYNVVYYELLPASLDKVPGIADFKTANVSWKVGHDNEPPDDIIEAKDKIVIPET